MGDDLISIIFLAVFIVSSIVESQVSKGYNFQGKVSQRKRYMTPLRCSAMLVTDSRPQTRFLADLMLGLERRA